MIIPLPAHTIYRKPSLKKEAEVEIQTSNKSAITTQILRLLATAVFSSLFFILWGPDEARLNNKLIIRKNSAKALEHIITVRYLNSQPPTHR